MKSKILIFTTFGFLVGLGLGLLLFNKYWKLQDYRMFPEEIVITNDSLISGDPDFYYFEALQIKNVLDSCYRMSNKNTISNEFSLAFQKFNNSEIKNKIFLLERNDTDFTVFYNNEYLITRDNIELVKIKKVITETEFEKKYHRKYKYREE